MAAATTTTTTVRPEEQLLLRVEQACSLLATSRTSLYRAIRRGEIQTILINGSQRRITRQALLEYIAVQQRQQSAGQK